MSEPAPRDSSFLPLIAAPAAWAAELLLGWYATTHCCAMRPGVHWLPSTCRAIGGAVAAVSLAVIAAALGGAIVARRRAAAADPDPAVAERRRFLATAAVFVAATLLVGTAWTAFGSLAGDLCGVGR